MGAYQKIAGRLAEIWTISHRGAGAALVRPATQMLYPLHEAARKEIDRWRMFWRWNQGTDSESPPRSGALRRDIVSHGLRKGASGLVNRGCARGSQRARRRSITGRRRREDKGRRAAVLCDYHYSKEPLQRTFNRAAAPIAACAISDGHSESWIC